jgi:hypothetical protein
MIAIVYGLYALFIFSYILLSFFVAYHLIKYSINPHFSRIMLLVFLVVSAFLLISNLALFFSVDWKTIVIDLLPNNLSAF